MLVTRCCVEGAQHAAVRPSPRCSSPHTAALPACRILTLGANLGTVCEMLLDIIPTLEDVSTPGGSCCLQRFVVFWAVVIVSGVGRESAARRCGHCVK